jgi:hypothetical protein
MRVGSEGAKGKRERKETKVGARAKNRKSKTTRKKSERKETKRTKNKRENRKEEKGRERKRSVTELLHPPPL